MQSRLVFWDIKELPFFLFPLYFITASTVIFFPYLFTTFLYVLFLGLTNIITVDLHSKEIQGFYDAPVDNLRASPFLVQYITDKVVETISNSGA